MAGDRDPFDVDPGRAIPPRDHLGNGGPEPAPPVVGVLLRPTHCGVNVEGIAGPRDGDRLAEGADEPDLDPGRPEIDPEQHRLAPGREAGRHAATRASSAM